MYSLNDDFRSKDRLLRSILNPLSSGSANMDMQHALKQEKLYIMNKQL